MNEDGKAEELLVGVALTYRLWVSADRCQRVELWSNGTCIISTRDHPADVWSPPIPLEEERTDWPRVAS